MIAGLTTGQTIAVIAVIWVSLAFLIGPLVGLWLRGCGDDEMSPDANGSGVDPAPGPDGRDHAVEPGAFLTFHSSTDSAEGQR